MLTYLNLPLYELTLDETSGVQLMSIVDNPAIQVDFLKFDNEVKEKFSINEDKHIITGACMIPELPIYRIIDGYECYVKFSAETIKELEQKFMAEQRTLSVNINHDKKTDDCIVIESFFIDKNRGISPVEFDLPDGTWMMSMKVNDEAIWNEIKKGNLNGFSIEGVFNLDTKNFNTQNNNNTTNFIDWLYKKTIEEI